MALTADTPIRPLAAVLLVLLTLAVAAILHKLAPVNGAGGDAFALMRAAFVVFIGVTTLSQLYDRARAWWTRRRTATVTSTPTPRGIRRSDLYIAVALILAALFLHAQSQRFVVTYTVAGGTPTFQRIDTWTGATEVWFMGMKNQPRPAWVRFTGQKAAR